MDQQTIADYPVGGAATTPTFRYVYASYIDEPVVRKTAGTGGTLVYFHRNHQYSVTAVTTSAGAISELYAYSAYGQPTILDASASVLSASAISNRYTYTGREWDATLGLHHFRARWMSPSAGRFLTRDPIGYLGGISLSAIYVGLSELDPDGKNIWVENGFQAIGLHSRICVTTCDANGNENGRRCFSFGLDGENPGSSGGSSGHSPGGGPWSNPGARNQDLPGVIDNPSGDGSVWEDDDGWPGTPRLGEFKTCCSQNASILAYLEAMVGQRGDYHIPFSTCRTFARATSRQIVSDIRSGKHGKCPPPPKKHWCEYLIVPYSPPWNPVF
jgi:RHS repeat-associated protein